MKTKYMYSVVIAGFILIIFCFFYFNKIGIKLGKDDSANAFMLSKNCSAQYFSSDLKIPGPFKFIRESEIECLYNTPTEEYAGFISVGPIGTHTNLDAPDSKYELRKSYQYNEWKVKSYSLKQNLVVGYMLFVIEKDKGYVMFNKIYLLDWFLQNEE